MQETWHWNMYLLRASGCFHSCRKVKGSWHVQRSYGEIGRGGSVEGREEERERRRGTWLLLTDSSQELIRVRIHSSTAASNTSY